MLKKRGAAAAIESHRLGRARAGGGRGYHDHDLLPEDLVIEILLRLPVESLLRFKTVCKNWCGLIKSSCFVNNHIHHHRTNHRPPALLLVNLPRSSDDSDFTTFPEEALASGTSHQYRNKLVNSVPRLPRFFYHHHRVLGPVNGLFLIVWPGRYDNTRHHLVLLNPATREWKPLVIPYSNYRPAFGKRFFFWNFGFGFDPLTNDYKVVMLPTSDVSEIFSVYSLANDSWKHMGPMFMMRNPGCRKLPLSTCSSIPYFNGACRWSCMDTVDGHHNILSFDMGAEVFREIKGPQETRGCPNEEGYLFVYDDSLAMLLYTPYSQGKAPIHLMVMKEEGCWIKQLTIVDTALLRVVRPHGMIWKDNNVILETYTYEQEGPGHRCHDPRGLYSQLVLYDTNSQELKESGIHRADCTDPQLRLFSYKESLVSLKNGRKGCYSLSDLLQDFDHEYYDRKND